MNKTTNKIPHNYLVHAHEPNDLLIFSTVQQSNMNGVSH